MSDGTSSTLAYISMIPPLVSEGSSMIAVKVIEKSEWNGIWAYPLNGIVCIVGIALQPVCAIINLIVAGIFKLIACCASEETAESWNEAAFENAGMATVMTVASIYAMAVKIWNPAFEVKTAIEHITG